MGVGDGREGGMAYVHEVFHLLALHAPLEFALFGLGETDDGSLALCSVCPSLMLDIRIHAAHLGRAIGM